MEKKIERKEKTVKCRKSENIGARDSTRESESGFSLPCDDAAQHRTGKLTSFTFNSLLCTELEKTYPNKIVSLKNTHDAIIIVFLVLLHHNASSMLFRCSFCGWPFCLLWLDCLLHHRLPTWCQTEGCFSSFSNSCLPHVHITQFASSCELG